MRGIDVFRTVQPNTGAQMYGRPSGPFRLICGGGTSTAYDSAPRHRPIHKAPTPRRAGRPTQANHRDRLRGHGRRAAVRPSQQLLVTLSGHIGSRQLSGPITKRVSNPAASSTAWVTAAERTTDRFGVSFDVLAAWLASEGLRLEASVALPVEAAAAGLRECARVLIVAGATGC